ncbi:acetyl-CoA acetyltransferase [Nocardioides marmorisolisilvae]|uniref:Acetyl-CoA acetyltransferase n=1 Tax=Nocardioides marmorisolisilvae TaxID=1542737 RepID=A0A3N0DU12_9ACTN|nr:acetyl-CoA acetyltransferase [Nocardioides marmorisolisilvae]RNL79011.1 acetyl-CoA acetyltransferase [Nocardioides marmorisolisilvae]
MSTSIDPRTPVLVGVGQATDVFGSDDYAQLSSADLAAAASRAAIEDAAGNGIGELIDVIACVRPMELSTPLPPALGVSTKFPRSVAHRLGITPEHAVLEVVGGQSPQHLVNEFAGRIAAGEYQAVLLAGGESLSTQAHFGGREDAPDFTEHPDGEWDDRGAKWEGLLTDNEIAHALFIMSTTYALMDHARRARLGLSVADYAQQIGKLFAPFSEVAAANPLASTRHVRSSDDLAVPSAKNPLISDPYTRWVVAREKVNLGAAVLLMSVEAARAAGVPEEKWVYLHGHADGKELPFLERPDLSTGPVAVRAAQQALEMAGVGAADLTTFDLYSCFAIPVFNITDALGIALDDPRRLTVTGGLPFFGGPGNNYSMHAVVETVNRMRENPGGYGFVGANGGAMHKYSVGIYSTTPVAWPGDAPSLSDEGERLTVALAAEGSGVIDTYTYSGDEQLGTVLGRLDSGERFVAHVPTDDPLFDLMRSGEAIGATVKATSADGINTVRLA